MHVTRPSADHVLFTIPSGLYTGQNYPDTHKEAYHSFAKEKTPTGWGEEKNTVGL
jgi:hypothetical protein